jgi:hypothetical protein
MDYSKHTIHFIENYLELDDEIVEVHRIMVGSKPYSFILTKFYIVVSRKGIFKNKVFIAPFKALKSYHKFVSNIIKFEDGTKIKFDCSNLDFRRIEYWLADLANENYVDRVKKSKIKSKSE